MRFLGCFFAAMPVRLEEVAGGEKEKKKQKTEARLQIRSAHTMSKWVLTRWCSCLPHSPGQSSEGCWCWGIWGDLRPRLRWESQKWRQKQLKAKHAWWWKTHEADMPGCCAALPLNCHHLDRWKQSHSVSPLFKEGGADLYIKWAAPLPSLHSIQTQSHTYASTRVGHSTAEQLIINISCIPASRSRGILDISPPLLKKATTKDVAHLPDVKPSL